MPRLIELEAAAFAGMFAVALLGKLDSWNSWRQTVRSLPLPVLPESPVRFGIPILEGATFAALVASPRIGLAASAAVLLVFAAAVALLHSAGSNTTCNCFGAISSKPLGIGLAARNATLAVIATAGAVGAKPHVASLPLLHVAVAISVAVLVVLLVEARRLFVGERAVLRLGRVAGWKH